MRSPVPAGRLVFPVMTGLSPVFLSLIGSTEMNGFAVVNPVTMPIQNMTAISTAATPPPITRSLFFMIFSMQ
jgi:hypothetical protein